MKERIIKDMNVDGNEVKIIIENRNKTLEDMVNNTKKTFKKSKKSIKKSCKKFQKDFLKNAFK